MRFYCVKDSTGSPIAYFYFDPYSRPSEKRGGAWMDEVVARSRALSRDGTKARLPIAHMVCNQTPPVGSKPSLMTFREVIDKPNTLLLAQSALISLSLVSVYLFVYLSLFLSLSLSFPFLFVCLGFIYFNIFEVIRT